MTTIDEQEYPEPQERIYGGPHWGPQLSQAWVRIARWMVEQEEPVAMRHDPDGAWHLVAGEELDATICAGTLEEIAAALSEDG